MKTILCPFNFFIIIFFVSTTLLAQAPDTLWTKTFDYSGEDGARSVQQTDDNGYIITGYTDSGGGVGTGEVLLIKTAPDLANNIKSAPILVTQYYLSQNHPNPFNPETVISYQLSVISDVELNIYNLLGQKVAVLISEKKVAGSHQVEWNASKFSSGVYYYQLMAGKYREVKKMILLK